MFAFTGGQLTSPECGTDFPGIWCFWSCRRSCLPDPLTKVSVHDTYCKDNDAVYWEGTIDTYNKTLFRCRATTTEAGWNPVSTRRDSITTVSLGYFQLVTSLRGTHIKFQPDPFITLSLAFIWIEQIERFSKKWMKEYFVCSSNTTLRKANLPRRLMEHLIDITVNLHLWLERLKIVPIFAAWPYGHNWRLTFRTPYGGH